MVRNITSSTATATAISTATASSPSIATTAAGAVFFKLLPLLAVVCSGNSFSGNSSRRSTDQAPYVNTPDP